MGVDLLTLDEARKQQRLDRPYVTPEQFGAKGDGATDDSDALRAAAATGRRLLLKRGATYLVSKQVKLETDGQVLDGNGATIKNRAQISTTTTTALASGVTTAITVASPAGLAVGQMLVLEKAGTYDTTAREIQSIVGTTVTFTTAVGITSASGTVNVYLALSTVSITGDRVQVRDLKIDGNRSNWSWARWWHTSLIRGNGCDDVTLDGCRLVEAPGEGVSWNDTDSFRVVRCTLYNIDGNGLHPGASATSNKGSRIIGNRLLNINLDTSVEHADGAICISATVSDLLIDGNYIEGAAVAGIGSIDGTTNQDITIVNNEFRSCTSYAIDGAADLDAATKNVVIANNRFYDSGPVNITSNSGSATANRTTRWVLANNVFSNTKVTLSRADDVTIKGNKFVHSTSNDSALYLVYVFSSQNVLIEGNTFRGGGYGVFLDSMPATVANTTVANNNFRGQGYGGIWDNSGSSSIVVSGNNVASDTSTGLAAYNGIRITGPSRAIGNVVRLLVGNVALYIGGGSNGIAMGNVVVKGGGSYSINTAGSTTNAQVINNVLDVAATLGGTTPNESGTVLGAT